MARVAPQTRDAQPPRRHRVRGVTEGAGTRETVVVTSSLLLLPLKIYSNIFSRISSAPGCALGLRLLHLQPREEVGK